MPKIFFDTDLHGSEMCWRKFLNAAKFYDADILICGGDMTGKAIVPIVQENGHFTFTLAGVQQAVGADQVGLADELIQGPGPHPGGEGREGIEALLGGVGEEVVGHTDPRYYRGVEPRPGGGRDFPRISMSFPATSGPMLLCEATAPGPPAGAAP